MTKSLPIYFSFLVVCAMVIVTFVTAKTYTQLSLAVVFYPMLAFFAYKILPHTWKQASKKPAHIDQPQLQEVTAHIDTKAAKTATTQIQETTVEISDINKRIFLKLIGATGLSFFLISLFSRKAEAFLFGQNQTQGFAAAGTPPSGTPGTITASPSEEYKISEVDDNVISYYGFIKKDGGWFVMKADTNNGSFRYTKGNSNFPDNWNKRAQLKYDYYQNVFST